MGGFFSMVEFTETAMRKMCRYPRCGSKLPEPVSNPREAFCARGCHTSFYRKRCLVCEGSMERKTENQLVCGKRKCRNALQGGFSFGRYHASSDVIHPLKASIKPGIKSGLKPDRAWRIVAGPELSPSAFHCATVPDGPGCQWKGGDYERTEAKNRAALKTDEEAEIEANGYFADSEWREATGPDGVKCFVARYKASEAKPHTMPLPIPDDVSIPEFLLRRPHQNQMRMAA
jgi:hypothetical protein